jgi:uncharacterized protein YlbG (UPF0298 family)
MKRASSTNGRMVHQQVMRVKIFNMGVLFMIGARQGIIAYLHTLKQVKMLRRFGNIHYVSKKLKYVVIYTNMEDVETTVEKLRSFSFVKRVDVSYKPFLKTEYENSRPDKAKEYDYKLGI